MVRATKIGLWGATGSGKTILLSNLSRSASRLHPSMGKWRVDAADDETSNWLIDREEELGRGVLPSETQAKRRVDFLRFDLTMLEPPPSTRLKPKGSIKSEPQTTTTLVVPDPSGQVFRYPKAEDTGAILVRSHFQDSDAFIYLFDPVREALVPSGAIDGLHRTNIGYLRHFLAALRLTASRGRNGHPHLLHQLLAVCVTKFDQLEVYREAVEGRWVTEDDSHPYYPRIPDSLARMYFESLCEGKPDANDVLAEINSNFNVEENVRYFASSSLGFVPSGTGFRSAISDGQVSNKGQPVNVLEPVVQLIHRHQTGHWIPDE